ncbi:TPR-like protein [Daedalea quercina L-15889]|uniref:TPR-like protein n=1 Tax=Daedalea quercina L-15889 TaxID=1314783 RepID=A0A165NG86_9APHY|nr:TPR-like protein [Daedalea quercina L-15889]
MSSPKGQHYWKQLREVLTAGRWGDPFPAKTPSGGPLSWPELLRKFNKHCPGHSHAAELALQTQSLSLLMSAKAAGVGLDGNAASAANQLALGEECMLHEERLEEAAAGYQALKGLETSNSDSIKLAVAYYAYALRRPSECLATLAEVQSLLSTDNCGPSSTTRNSTLTLPVPNGGPGGSVSSAWTGSDISAVSLASIAEVSDGSAWAATERIRSICLQGMSHESITPDDPQKALDAYLTALPLVSGAIADIPPYMSTQPASAPAGPTTVDTTSFGRYRELWRWVERLLRRAILLASRLCDVRKQGNEATSIWTLLDRYHSCSAHWPPMFRPVQRSTVAVLHLRAFVLRAYASPTQTTIPTSRAGVEKPHRWISAARSVIQEYRAILSVSTKFPKAGERNVQVEDLVDLSVAVWEADGAVGEYAGWVIDVLWWATRLTFNSYKVYRHMARLLYVSGDAELAKRTLRLYVQVVGKARETTLAQGDAGTVLGNVDMDTDHNWVETCVQGARMLCRLALAETDGRSARLEVKEAGTLIERAKERLDANDRELVGSVRLVEGIWQSVMAQIKQDPRTRQTRLSDSLALLQAAADSHSTPSVHHHLALAYSRPGPTLNLQKAISSARLAVEGEPSEIRHWHLLGLLLTATGDWRAAQGVFEIGAGVGEVDLAEEGSGAGDDTELDTANGVVVHDYATQSQVPRINGNGNADPLTNDDSPRQASPSASLPVTLLDRNAQSIPESATLLRPIGDRPPPSRNEAFEHALQLRMSQLTLAEYVEGPEGAGDRWVEVFYWFSERRELGIDDRRLSIDSRADTEVRSTVPSTEKTAIAPSSSGRKSLHLRASIDTEKIPMQDTPIPITVTPASPGIPPSSNDDHSTTEENIHERRSSSFDDPNRDMSRGKKVREAVKRNVHKGQAGITKNLKKIGHNVGKHGGGHPKRSNSAPDLHAVLGHSPYQASSIHLRQHYSIHTSQQDLSIADLPPPPLLPPPPPSQSPMSTLRTQGVRAARDRRLLSNLWLMSAATFRRLGKIEQARAAIQEAEVRDENNPAVWVQLGLYYMALSNRHRAMEAFQKALFIAPDDISATIHLCRLYLTPSSTQPQLSKATPERPSRDNIDLAVGLLSDLTRGAAWDVPEAWYFLAKQYGVQGRKDRERECLCFALTLSESRGLRDLGVAVGWCL